MLKLLRAAHGVVYATVTFVLKAARITSSVAPEEGTPRVDQGLVVLKRRLCIGDLKALPRTASIAGQWTWCSVLAWCIR